MKGRLKRTVQAFARRFTKRLLGRNAYAIVAKTPSGLFAIDPEDVGSGSVGRALLRHDGHGAADLDLLRARLTPSDRLLVVGAHIGTLAIPLAKHCREVVAVEANPATHELLRLNLALNGVANCTTLNLAASNAPGRLEFLLSRANSGGSKRMPVIREPLYFYDSPEVTTVEGARLDDRLGDEAFDAIIVDIEGSEVFALRGMQRLLRDARLLQIEFLPHHLRNVGAVSVEEFVSLIAPHFDRLTIPSRNAVLGRNDFAPALRRMYDRDEEDGGLLFEKVAPPA